jgi:hypothetical protein
MTRIVTHAPAGPRWPAWAGPVVAAGALTAGLMVAYALIYHGDVSSLVCADPEKIGRWPFEAVGVGFPTHGFDGQFYYALARGPWGPHPEFLDAPAYRHVRVLVPAAAWLLTGGDPRAVLWALPALNWAAVVVLAWLGAVLAAHYGRSPWWGFVLVLAINVCPAALRDLTDPVAMCACCGVVAGWLLGWRAGTVALWGVAAVLAREQNLLVVGLVLLESALARRFALAGALAVPLLVWGAWACVLRQWYGAWPFVAVNSAAPFTGINYRLHHMTGSLGTGTSKSHSLAMLTLGVQLALSLALPLARAPRLTSLLALAGAALAIQGGSEIYGNLESYTRVFWWMPLAVWLWGTQTRRIWPGVVVGLAAMWPCYSLLQAVHNVLLDKVVFIASR